MKKVGEEKKQREMCVFLMKKKKKKEETASRVLPAFMYLVLRNRESERAKRYGARAASFAFQGVR